MKRNHGLRGFGSCLVGPLLWACVDTEQPGRKAMEKQCCSPPEGQNPQQERRDQGRPEGAEEGCEVPSSGLSCCTQGLKHSSQVGCTNGTCQLPFWMVRRLLRSHTSCAATGKLMISREGGVIFFSGIATGWCPCSRK